MNRARADDVCVCVCVSAGTRVTKVLAELYLCVHVSEYTDGAGALGKGDV